MRNVSKDFVLSHLLCNPRLKRWRHPSFAEFLGSFLFCRPSKNAPTCSNSSFLSSLKCWCLVAIYLATRVRRTHSSFIDVRERSRKGWLCQCFQGRVLVDYCGMIFPKFTANITRSPPLRLSRKVIPIAAIGTLSEK